MTILNNFSLLCFYFSKLLNFIKKDIASNDLLNDKVLSSSWMLTSEATWRSEVVAFFFADIWLNYNVFTIVSLYYYTILKYSLLA